jgi:photosystem II stability/assembly factor-like uncharacterized protein
LDPKNGGKIAVAIGTQQGGYLMTSDSSRTKWRRHGPFLARESVNNITYDPKNNVWYAATLTEGVFVSRDGGKTWRPTSRGLNVRKVWTVEVDPHDSSLLYAGTHYGHLFQSKDAGKNWEEVAGLHTAPRRNEWGVDWAFGTTGLCIHTIRIDPNDSNRVYIVAAGQGTYRSDDGGNTWKSLMTGVNVSCPVFKSSTSPNIPRKERSKKLKEHLQVHSCTHKLVLSSSNPNVLYQQNHCGVFRSTNAGDRWQDRSPGQSTRHGFPIILVENHGEALYTVPAYQGTCKEHNSCIQGELAVYRSTNGGKNWRRLAEGLPKRMHTCVLRDAMATDRLDPAGIYVGTTTGELFATRDGGKTWSKAMRGIGRVQGVSSFVLAE